VNLGGVQEDGSFSRFLKRVARMVREDKLDALICQEHNLNPSRVNEVKRMALSKQLEMHISFSSEESNGVYWGGTLVLLNIATCANASVLHSEAGATVVQIEWSVPYLHAIHATQAVWSASTYTGSGSGSGLGLGDGELWATHLTTAGTMTGPSGIRTLARQPGSPCISAPYAEPCTRNVFH
jgi:hypothetical protein